jgi:hypothetical protein
VGLNSEANSTPYGKSATWHRNSLNKMAPSRSGYLQSRVNVHYAPYPTTPFYFRTVLLSSVRITSFACRKLHRSSPFPPFLIPRSLELQISFEICQVYTPSSIYSTGKHTSSYPRPPYQRICEAITCNPTLRTPRSCLLSPPLLPRPMASAPQYRHQGYIRTITILLRPQRPPVESWSTMSAVRRRHSRGDAEDETSL